MMVDSDSPKGRERLEVKGLLSIPALRVLVNE